MKIVKVYEEPGIRCEVSPEGVAVTGADGQYHFLQDWFAVQHVQQKKKEYLDELLSAMDEAKSENARRVYDFDTFQDTSHTRFGRKSDYAELTVKYPVNSKGWIWKYTKLVKRRVPLAILRELLALYIECRFSQDERTEPK